MRKLIILSLLCSLAFAQGVGGKGGVGGEAGFGGGAVTVPSWTGVQGFARVTAFGGGACVLSITGLVAGDEVTVFDNDQTGGTSTLAIHDPTNGAGKDSLGNTWTQNAICNSTTGSPTSCSSDTFAAFQTTATTGGTDTVTVTTSGTGTGNCWGLENRWSLGGLVANPTDAIGSTQQFTTNHSVTTTGNLTANGELVIGGFFSGATMFTAAGAGFTALGGDASGFPTAQQSFGEYKPLASGAGSGATQTAPAVDTGGTAFGIVVTYKHP